MTNCSALSTDEELEVLLPVEVSLRSGLVLLKEGEGE